MPALLKLSSSMLRFGMLEEVFSYFAGRSRLWVFLFCVCFCCVVWVV